MAARPVSDANVVIHWSPGANWKPGTIFDQDLDDHVAYLQDLYEAGVVIGAGPMTDGSAGMTRARVESDEAAQRLIDNDPAVRRGVFVGRFIRWSPLDWEARMIQRRETPEGQDV